MVPRPVGKDIEFSVAYKAAVPHWRSLEVSASGCGGGNMVLSSGPLTASRWHTDPLINFFNGTAVYTLPPPRCRALTPSTCAWTAAPSTPTIRSGLSADWYYNPLHVYNFFSLQVAVVNV